MGTVVKNYLVQSAYKAWRPGSKPDDLEWDNVAAEGPSQAAQEYWQGFRANSDDHSVWVMSPEGELFLFDVSIETHYRTKVRWRRDLP